MKLTHHAKMDDDRPQLMLDPFITSMMLLLRQRQADNFDQDRFGAASPSKEVFDVDLHRNYFFFLLENFSAVSTAHDIFEDEASCRLYRDLIEYRLVGHLHKRLPTNAPDHWAARTAAQALRSSPSPFASRVQHNALGLPLERVTVPFKGRELEITCWKLACAWTFILNQYYFERGGVRIAPAPGDHIIDGGMLFAETAIRMAVDAGPSGRVYSFEPVGLHCEIAADNVKRNPVGAEIRIFGCGLAGADTPGVVSSAASLLPGYRLEQGIATRSIDSLVREGEIERVDFIKLDIEGSELSALREATDTLRRFRPKLAISLYHKAQDLFEIPLFLDSLLDDYAFYLDHYTIHAEETVLYARPLT